MLGALAINDKCMYKNLERTFQFSFNSKSAKMKIVLIAFALLGLAYAAPTRTLQEDLQEFLDLIPREEIRGIVRRYLDTDEEFQSVVLYLQGPEWAALVGEVADKQAWINFKAYMLEAGVDVDAIIKYLHDLIQGAKPNPPKVAVRGVREFLDEVIGIMPVDDLLALLDDKLQNSPEFQEFYGKISSDAGRGFVEDLRALPEIQRIADVLREYSIDVDRFLEIVYGLLGWN